MDFGPPPAGHRLGKYELVRRLGQGAMGVVYEAVHTGTLAVVALKVLSNAVAEDVEVVARFAREARAAGQLRSRNVARILDFDHAENGLPFIVMEYLEGHDLASEIKRRGQLPIGEAVGFVLQACSGMAEAHKRGIVHRDLKPANLFLARDGTQSTIKILDFGVSKAQTEADAELTTAQATVGSPAYMAPEQIRASRDVDGRADIWSLGVVLYRLLAGQMPFLGAGGPVMLAILNDPPQPIKNLRTDVPEALERAMLMALEKDMPRRYQAVEEFARAIAPFADDSRATIDALSELRVLTGPGLTGAHPALSLEAVDARLSSAAHTALGTAAFGTTGDVTASRSVTMIGPPLTPRNRIPLVVAGVVALLALGGGLVFVLRPKPVTAVAAGGPSASVAAVPPTDATNGAPHAPPVDSAPPHASATGSAGPETTPSASASATAGPTEPIRKTPPKPSATPTTRTRSTTPPSTATNNEKPPPRL